VPPATFNSEKLFEKIAGRRNFFVEPTANQGEREMNREFQQYRFARLEAQNITRARLEAQFKEGIGGLEKIETAIEHLMMTESTCTPWRQSEVERAGSRDGARMAALEFYWAYRRRRPSSSQPQGISRRSVLRPGPGIQ
jgi:hypothetical protein